ncbi:MAG: Nramp family divalent metal transporter [Vicinamibacterales bacterium]|nr:Nramp family divalent metal transporter [Vicinamibacterales bacterium]
MPSPAVFPPREVRDLPESPRNLWKIVGPGIVASGIGLSSGEFILWPYIASQVGLVLLWGALLGVVTQFFLNMEVERYTLATAETVVTGFNRFWKHWGLVFALMTYFANAWPGWAFSSATLTTYLVGGNAAVIGVLELLVIGAALTLAPVIYVALERLIFVKVAAVVILVILAIAFVVQADSWRALPSGLTNIGHIPPGLPIALIFGAIAFAGAGGGQNLCQSNYIRDKGFGMGQYVPRLVSPLTGTEVATADVKSFIFETTPANMTRWRRWWNFANIEQFLSFVVVTIVTIGLTSMLAHSTLFGEQGLPTSVAFLQIEAQRLTDRVGRWFGVLFLGIGAFSLFGSAMGIVDYTSRLAADTIKTTYLRTSPVTESRLYVWLVWGMVAFGIFIVGLRLVQPLALLIISASIGGTMMFMYSILLLMLNRTHLPDAIKIRSYRVAAIAWSVLFFGTLAALTIWAQLATLRS